MKSSANSHAVAATMENYTKKKEEMMKSRSEWMHRKISNFHKNRFIVPCFYVIPSSDFSALILLVLLNIFQTV